LEVKTNSGISYKVRLMQLALRLIQVSAVIAVSVTAAHAQSAQNATLPLGITENGSIGSMQGISSGLSFLIYSPTAKPGAPTIGQPATAACGVTEDYNILSPGSPSSMGLALTGAALYSIPSSGSTSGAQKQAINQTLSYNHGPINLSVGFLDVGKLFAVDNSASSPLAPAMAGKLLSEKGQDGFNSGLNYSQDGTKFGLQFSSIADSLQSQHKFNTTLSMERDFDKALSLSFQTIENTSEQMSSNAASHMTTDILHLAYSPTRTGFLLDAKNTSTFGDQGAQTNDLMLKVAKQFSALNLSSQFESSTSSSAGSSSASFSQRFDASDTIRKGLTFSGYWAKRTVEAGSETDDYDVIIKSAENRFLALSAEYAKHDALDGSGTGKQSLVASITPGAVGPLGPLLLNLSINNQQSQMLDGFQSYSASLSGQLAPSKRFDFGLPGAKYVLAYSDASAGGNYAINGHAVSHSARTLRLVSAPAGKNGLSWTVSQQQRLDGNGQALRTASDYETKYTFNHRLSIAANSIFETAKPDGSFTDMDQQGFTMNWNQTQSCSMIAQYVHSRCPSQNIAGEDGYTLTCSGMGPQSRKMDLGIGEQTKRDFNGYNAFGTSANVAYAWKADDSNLLNITSKVTNWQNHGFNNDYDTSVEAAGQINFQRLF